MLTLSVKPEEWKNIQYKGVVYKELISTRGRVLDTEGNVINLSENCRGPYYYVTIHPVDESLPSKYKQVHRLVASTFLDVPDYNMHVHHINHNNLDNRVENLMWISASDHAKDSGTYSNENMLDDTTVLGICEDLAKDVLPVTTIGKTYHCPITTVYNILHKRSYTKLSEPYWDKFDQTSYIRRDRSAYKDELDCRIAQGYSYTDLVNWLVEAHGLDYEDASYYYSYRRSVYYKNDKSMRNDGRYKYQHIIPRIYTDLINGISRKRILEYLQNDYGLDYSHSKDLLRQRIRAFLECKAEGVDYKSVKVMLAMDRVRKEQKERLDKAAKAKYTKAHKNDPEYAKALYEHHLEVNRLNAKKRRGTDPDKDCRFKYDDAFYKAITDHLLTGAGYVNTFRWLEKKFNITKRNSRYPVNKQANLLIEHKIDGIDYEKYSSVIEDLARELEGLKRSS